MQKPHRHRDEQSQTNTHPRRVAKGDSWDGLEAKAEEVPHRTQGKVLLYTLIPTILIFILLVLHAMSTEDEQHIDDAWALTNYAICTALGWAAGRRQN